MTAMIKKFKVIAILLSMMLIVGIAGCGKSKTSQRKGNTQVAQGSASNVSNTAAPGDASATPVEPEDIPIQSRILPANGFGRDDPFVPLAGSTGGKTTIPEFKEKKPVYVPGDLEIVPKAKPEPAPLPNIRLSLIIDESTAIFIEDNRNSKVASVGDMVFGMKVLEIRNNEAVLSNGSKKFTVTKGGIREETSAPAVIKSSTPKGSKAKKK